MAVVVVPAAIPERDCQHIIAAFEQIRADLEPGPAIGGPSAEIGLWAQPPKMRVIVAGIVAGARELAVEAFGDPLHAEAAYVTWLGPGAHHAPHADNVRETEGGWVPNHTPQRAVSGVCYLNGGTGTTCFSDGTTIEPAAGLLILFDAGAAFQHWTEPVETLEGRYAIPMWFTRDRRFALQHP